MILFSRELNRFFRGVLASMEAVYLSRNPTAKAILELVGSASDEQIYYDHFAFRTFGVNGYGIDSMAKIFLDFGYTPREELRFPAKKLRALWFSPPSVPIPHGGIYIHTYIYIYQYMFLCSWKIDNMLWSDGSCFAYSETVVLIR
ncbi:hypothetical protein ACFX2I_011377 [Malus domestica]